MSDFSDRQSAVGNPDSSDRQSAVGNPEFGGRTLTREGDVFDHNAWDNVPWDAEHQEMAEAAVSKQWSNPVPEADRAGYNDNANKFWDQFYEANANNFFKDRHWLRLEFPELFDLLDARESDAALTGDSDSVDPACRQLPRINVFEIGCGAGNTVFPLLAEDINKQLYVFAADFSKTAIDVVKSHAEYNEERCKAFVYDITCPEQPPEIAEGTIDTAANNIFRLLKPGGLVLFRDYGRYDLAQLRFKGGRLLADNFYIRGDGTQVYFFTQEEVAQFFAKFDVVQNAVDRRLIVNRARKIKMHRVWMQGKFRKPPPPS